MGEYSQGGGPASSFNVYFYDNGTGNLPGATRLPLALICPYTGTPPDFTINLVSPVTLGPGTRIGSPCKPAKISIPTVNGSGTIVRSNQTLALPGRTPPTVTAPAAPPGTERTPACPTKYRPTRCSKSSASWRGLRRLQRLQPRLLPRLGSLRLRDLALVPTTPVTFLMNKKRTAALANPNL